MQDAGHQLGGVEFVVAEDRSAARGFDRKTNLVGFEGRRLHDDLRTVLERPFRRAEHFVERLLFHGRALERLFVGNQRLLHHIVHIGFDFGGAGFLDHREDFRFRRVVNSLFLGCVDHDHPVFGLDHLLADRVDVVDGDRRDQRAVELPFVFGIGDGIAFLEVHHQSVFEFAVEAVVAVGVLAFGETHQIVLRPLELALRVSVAADLLHFEQKSFETFVELTVFGLNLEHRGFQRRDETDAAVAHARVEERGVGLLRDLFEAGVLHQRDVVEQNVLHLTQYETVRLPGHGGALDEHGACRGGHLGIGEHRNDRFVVVRHHDRLFRRSVCRGCGNVRHQGFQVRFGLVHVDVAHDHDGLIVGAVPLVVEVFDVRVGETLQTFERADHVADFVLGAFADMLHHIDGRTPAGTVARAQLLRDHAALGVDLLGLEGDEVRPVVQDEHRRVDDALTRGRNVFDHVRSFVPRRVSVQIVSEFHAYRLQIFEHLLARQVFRSVESHVFEEVCETLLVVGLLYGADVVQDVEARLSLGLFIVANVVGQPVVEFAHADFLVRRYGLHRIQLCLCVRHREERGGNHHQ